MPATGHSSWADLNSEPLVSIAATAKRGSSLFDYVCLRGVCAAWRSALPPPYPCLLSLHDDRASSASVFSFPMRRSFRLYTAVQVCFDVTELPTRARVSGNRPIALAANGRLADRGNGHRTRVVGSGHGRLAFAIDSSTSKDTYYVGCWTVRIFVLDPRTGDGNELLPPRNPTNNNVKDCEYVKLLFAPDPDDATVVAMCSCTKVAYVDTSNSKSRKKLDLVWTTVDVVSGCAEHLVDLAFDDTRGGKVYCLDSRGGVHVLRVSHGGRNSQEAPAEPSLTIMSVAFNPPNDLAFTLTSRKHLFFCCGSLYQVWQNNSSTVRSCSGLTMFADQICVLRYDPAARQSWSVVKDLGGCSVFIGKNSSPAVVRAGTLRGVRGDCVYWIDWRHVPMVCDVATRTSKPCKFPGGTRKGNCWYFGHDKYDEQQEPDRDIEDGETIKHNVWI